MVRKRKDQRILPVWASRWWHDLEAGVATPFATAFCLREKFYRPPGAEGIARREQKAGSRRQGAEGREQKAGRAAVVGM